MRKGQGAFTLSQRGLLSPHCHLFTRREALKMLLLEFMEALLHRHNWLNHWSLETNSTSSPSTLLGGQGMGFIWIVKYFIVLLLFWIEWFSITRKYFVFIFYFYIVEDHEYCSLLINHRSFNNYELVFVVIVVYFYI